MAVSTGQVLAQSTPARVYDEQLRVKLDQINPESREKDFDVGGWLNAAIFDYDDAPARISRRQMRQYELRAWASMNLKGVHQAYVRGRANYDDWSGQRHDEHGVEVERAWYQFDLGKLLEQQSGSRAPVGVKVRL